MVERAGIGATVAAAVIFSILLASNFAVYYSAQEDAQLHSTSNAMDALADESAAFEGAGAADILLREQAFLGSKILDCGSAISMVSAEISSLVDVQTSANLTVITSASLAPERPAADNLSMLAPFGGYVAGFLDTVLYQEAKGSENALGVSYVRNESHYVNLPVRIGDMAEDCDLTLSNIESLASSAVPRNCSVSTVSSLVAAAAEGSDMEATASGIHLVAGFTIVGMAQCSVKVTVTVSQDDVMGPGGEFTVKLQGGALVDFEP